MLMTLLVQHITREKTEHFRVPNALALIAMDEIAFIRVHDHRDNTALAHDRQTTKNVRERFSTLIIEALTFKS